MGSGYVFGSCTHWKLSWACRCRFSKSLALPLSQSFVFISNCLVICSCIIDTCIILRLSRSAYVTYLLKTVVFILLFNCFSNYSTSTFAFSCFCRVSESKNFRKACVTFSYLAILVTISFSTVSMMQ